MGHFAIFLLKVLPFLKFYQYKDVRYLKIKKEFRSKLNDCKEIKHYIKNNELVIAYRGTERLGLGENISNLNVFMKDVLTDVNMMTATFDMQFKDAWEFYKTVKSQNPKRKIVIVGQSLGGALAQIVSAKEYTVNRKKIKTYTLNPKNSKAEVVTDGISENLFAKSFLLKKI